jgi:hypothetical protein
VDFATFAAAARASLSLEQLTAAPEVGGYLRLSMVRWCFAGQ